MLRIGFSGIPCTGKSSTARALVGSGNIPHIKNAELVSEYARHYISKYKSIDHIWEQYRIINKQIELERSLSANADMIVTDSPLPLAFLYASDLNRGSVKDNMVFSDIFNLLLNYSSESPYDIIFHLEPFSIPIESDGIRPSLHLQAEWRAQSDEFIRTTFNLFKPKQFIIVKEKSMQDRVDFCIEVITNHTQSN